MPHAGVFLTFSKSHTPTAFEVFLKRTSSLPSVVIFLRIKQLKIPVVAEDARVKVNELIKDKVFYMTVSFGYAEHVGTMVIPSIIMRGLELNLPPITLDQLTLFVPADRAD